MKTGKSVSKNDLVFRVGITSEAVALVKRFHYLGTIPSGVFFCGRLHLRRDSVFDGDCVAAAFFSRPTAAFNWPVKVVELTRLVRDDQFKIQLTFLLSQCVKQFRKPATSSSERLIAFKTGNGEVIKSKIESNARDLLIAYADLEQGHEGAVYRAASWVEITDRKPKLVKWRLDGVEYHTRTVLARYKTHAEGFLRDRFKSVEPVYDKGKRLFAKPINKRGEKIMRYLFRRELSIDYDPSVEKMNNKVNRSEGQSEKAQLKFI